MSPADRRFLLAVCAAAALWGAFYVARTSFEAGGERVFSLWDDAMVSMTYARNLAEGVGLVWVPGEEPVQGYTNLGVTLMMALVHTLPIAPERTSLVVQAIALGLHLATIVLAFRAASILVPDSRWPARGAALAVAVNATLAVWSLQGSDAGFLAAWLTASYVAVGGALASGGGFSWPVLALVAAGPLLRPDAAMWSVALVGAAAAGGRLRDAVRGGVLLALVIGAFFAFGALVYGDPLPNTWYLKATGAPRAQILASGLAQLASLAPGLAPVVVLGALGVLAERRRPEAWLAGVLLTLPIAWHVAIGGDWAVVAWGSRFVAPALPVGLALAAAGAHVLVRAVAARVAVGRLAGPATLVVAAIAGLVASPRTALVEWTAPWTTTMYRDANQTNYLYGRYIRERLPADSVVAVHWAGVSVYFGRLVAVDVLGKSDRHIARLDVPHFFPAHSKWDWDYVLRERRPDVFLLATRGLPERADFRASYYAVQSMGIVLYVRRDRIAALDDPEAWVVDLATGRAIRRSELRVGRSGGGGGG